MKNAKELVAFLETRDVKDYVLVDGHARIAATTLAEPEGPARLTAECGLDSRAMGKDNFRYLVFFTETAAFFIFPVGKYYLGMIKHTDTKDKVQAEAFAESVKDALGRTAWQ